MTRAFALIAALALAAPAAASERYDPQQAGHPLRIAAYILHPVGYIFERVVLYPAWVIGSWRPIGVLVGREPVQPDPAPAPLRDEAPGAPQPPAP